jgi:putative ABC transport system substrate-binding protein
MERREFITLLSAPAAAWPLEARAQQPAKVPIIGFLGATTPQTAGQWDAAFRQRLRALGWIDGRNIGIEYRWAEGRNERFAEIATEFVQLKVDVIVTYGTAPVLAAKQVTSTIPIVFAAATDPVGIGLVASLARPGGNITGHANQAPDMAGKRVELLREIVPQLRRLAIMVNANVADALTEMRDVQAAAHALEVQTAIVEIRRAEDIAPAFDTFKDQVQALFVVGEPLAFTNRVRIISFAFSARLPTMFALREYVEAGGLISYGPNFQDNFRRAAEFVDKILRGTKPSDIPVEQPTKFDLVVNLITAKAIGLTIPETFLVRATEVIE